MSLPAVPLQPGDLFACWSTDPIGRTISAATSSPFAPRGLRWAPSHVAMVCEYHGRMRWVESTTLSEFPCVVRGERVRGCQAHEPMDRITEYRKSGGKVALYRLTPINQLSTDESGLLTDILIRHFVKKGIGYDKGGAILSGTRALKLTRLLPSAQLDRVFCSELAAAALMRLGRLARGNPTRYNPSDLLRELIAAGTYALVPRWDLPADVGPPRHFKPAHQPAEKGGPPPLKVFRDGDGRAA